MFEILLSTIIAILIFAIVAVVSVLCTPMRISVMFDTRNRPRYCFKVVLLGGLFPIVLAPKRWSEPSTGQRTKEPSHRSRAAQRRYVSAYAPRMLCKFPGLVFKVFSRVKLERLEAKIRFGLPDPAETGIVYGALTPLLQFIDLSERSNIVVHPDFGSEVFDGRGHLGTRFLPIALVAPVLGFAWVTMVAPRLTGVFR